MCRASLLCLLGGTFIYAQPSREQTAWWVADGLLTYAQQQDLDLQVQNAGRWCELVELWLGEQCAREQGCAAPENPRKDWAAQAGWRASLDSNGAPRAQTLGTGSRAGAFALEAETRADSSWNQAHLQRVQAAWKSKQGRVLAGDFSGGEAGLDAWAGDFRGGLAEGRSAAWTGSVLVAGTDLGGVHGGYTPARQARSDVWLFAVRGRPLLWAGWQSRPVQASVRTADPRAGTWTHVRYRLAGLGGDLHLRTGTELPPLLDLPKSFENVRLWSAQWQEAKRGEWRLRISETAVLREPVDSLAFSLLGERRRDAGGLAAQAACRAAREGCALPRAGLAAGWKPLPRGPDSLFTEARWQGARLGEMGHAPRMLSGWTRRLGKRAELEQAVLWPENARADSEVELRQRSRMRFAFRSGATTSLSLRWSLRFQGREAVRLGVFGIEFTGRL